MNLFQSELCATCPKRGNVSSLLAGVVLGRDYTADNCDGSVVVRKDHQQFTNRLGSTRLLGGAITEVQYGCGQPDEEGKRIEGYKAFNWLDGHLVGIYDSATDSYAPYSEPHNIGPEIHLD